MKLILMIGFGGFIGTVLRYIISVGIQNKFLSTWPLGTFAVNIAGCFLIGIIYALSDKGTIPAEWRLFIATGILGGFTTFSSFSNETVNMLRNSQYLYAFGYVSGSVVLGLASTFAGILLIKAL